MTTRLAIQPRSFLLFLGKSHTRLQWKKEWKFTRFFILIKFHVKRNLLKVYRLNCLNPALSRMSRKTAGTRSRDWKRRQITRKRKTRKNFFQFKFTHQKYFRTKELNRLICDYWLNNWVESRICSYIKICNVSHRQLNVTHLTEENIMYLWSGRPGGFADEFVGTEFLSSK